MPEAQVFRIQRDPAQRRPIKIDVQVLLDELVMLTCNRNVCEL